MSVNTLTDNTTHVLGDGLPSTYIVTFDIGQVFDVKLFSASVIVSSPVYYMHYSIEYSFDNITYLPLINTIADDAPTLRVLLTDSIVDASTQFVYFRFTAGTIGTAGAISNFDELTIKVNDLVIASIDVEEPTLLWVLSQPFNGYAVGYGETIAWSFPHITTQVDGGDGGDGGVVDPTSTNIVSGNVSKLGLPFKANVVAVSIGLDPEVVGETVSNDVTGDYTLDIFPHTEEVLLYVAPDYGRAFSPSLLMTTGQIMHPTTPNKYVYVAQNNGTVGLIEPNWGVGQIVSNQVTFLAEPLYRPLINGFIKPTITLI